MGGSRNQVVVAIVMAVVMVIAISDSSEAAPPGLSNPSHASCQNGRYKYCKNLVHVCPKFCPNGCDVECVSCKPYCIGSPTTTPPPPPPPPSVSQTPSPPPPTPSPPPPASDQTPPPPSQSVTPPPPTPSNNPPPSPTPSPPPPSVPPSPPSPTPSPPASAQTPPPPSQPVTPPPSTPSNNPPPSPTSSPPASPQTPPPPSQSVTPSPPTPSGNTPPSPMLKPPSSPTPSPSPNKAKCKNKNYSNCYGTEHVCPSSCPSGCEVDCVTCKPVCSCDRPGAVCQDPRFIGGDGITFYFHGKKDHDFCLLSDPNLHINAHFIGKRNVNMTRDFTWVQSIAILFDNHQLFLGALKTSTWDDSIDRLSLTFDGEPLTIATNAGTMWQPRNVPGLTITRPSDNNNIVLEVERRFRVTAKAVPITKQESRIHNYGITDDDCFAHLDLGFKFYSLSDQVNGVLGQTYRPDYASNINVGAKMAVMGGTADFQTSSLFSADCAVASYTTIGGGIGAIEGGDSRDGLELELPSLSCASGIDGQGVVCKI